jgi:hypothetical protein
MIIKILKLLMCYMVFKTKYLISMYGVGGGGLKSFTWIVYKSTKTGEKFVKKKV